MPADHLFADRLQDLVQVEVSAALVNAGHEENLKQKVSQKVLELEQERAKVIQAGKLAALGEMATGVAHELNQPLTAMLFDAEYLEIVARKAQAGESDAESHFLACDLSLAALQVAQAVSAGDIQRVRSIYSASLRAIALISFPICFGGIAVAAAQC